MLWVPEPTFPIAASFEGPWWQKESRNEAGLQKSVLREACFHR